MTLLTLLGVIILIIRLGLVIVEEIVAIITLSTLRLGRCKPRRNAI